MSDGKDSKDKCAEDWGKESYTALIGRFKNQDGRFKRYVIATDSEFGPSWPARNHSEQEISVSKTEVHPKYKNGVFKYKALQDVNHLKVENQKSGNFVTYFIQSRRYSAHKLRKKPATKAQWYGSSSGPVWARLYSTVFWIYVEDNGERQTHKLVFPWYIYENEKKTFLQMRQDNNEGIPNANSTVKEQKLLQLMAKCWVELISHAQLVIAWSSNAIDITLPLEWFALNDVFEISNDQRIAVLRNMGWSEKNKSYPGDLMFSKKNPTKYIDLSAAFVEDRNLEDAARKWLTRTPDDAFKLLDFAALDKLFAAAEDGMTVHQKLCYPDHEFDYDKLIFSRYDLVCAHLTERHDRVNDRFRVREGSSLLKYNDTDVCLMHELMAIDKRPKKLAEIVPFMYDENDSFKYKLPNREDNPLVFADLHNDVRRALEDPGQEAAAAPATELEDQEQEAAKPQLKRQNAGVWGSSNPSAKVGRANAYLVVTGNGGLW